MAKPSPFHVGVLVVPTIQLLDVAPVDLFAMLQPEYLKACSLPASLVNLGLPVKITYIAESGPGSHAPTTAEASIVIHAGLDQIVPGSLDVVFIPGPDPRTVPSEPVREFIRKHVAAGCQLLTVCTGIFIAAYSGVLDGRRATGPRALVDLVLKNQFPAIRWQNNVRWSNDGNIWTAGGITNGNDMVAAYMRKRFPGPIAETVLTMADVGERGNGYRSSAHADTLWWASTVFRAWVGSFFTTKSA